MSKRLVSLQDYLRRSAKYLGKQASEATSLTPKIPREKTLFEFKEPSDLERWIVGSDADVGGASTAQFGVTAEGTAVFSGTLSLAVPAGATVQRSGYAAVRSRQPPVTLLHREFIDLGAYDALAIRCRGDDRQYMVNVSTDNPFPAYLHQHRLHLRTPGAWETVHLPLRDFTLTAYGFTQRWQWEMMREKIRTVGLSVARQEGPFELELAWVRAVRTNVGSSAPLFPPMRIVPTADDRERVAREDAQWRSQLAGRVASKKSLE